MNLLKDIFGSFGAHPLWVKIWMILILAPVNFATLYFLDEPHGQLIAGLAIGGIAVNIIPLILDRGFGKAMAISHVVFWIPLIFVILFMAWPNLDAGLYRNFLIGLLAVDLFSLAFDVRESVEWFKGDRGAPR